MLMFRTPAALRGAMCAFTLLVAPTAALADDPTGSWKVNGKVSSFAFTLHCLFKTSAGKLTGVCQDGATNAPNIKGGAAHPLTAGFVNGTHVSWTYQSNFLFTHFDVTYAGALAGDHMEGVVRASGREGAFTAQRE